VRLPWPFRRTDTQRPMADPVGTQPAAAPSFGRVAQRQEWRDLPPLDETIAPPPLVAPNSRFSAGLAVNNPPPPALAPLGHQRSLEAPPGLALGFARPIAAPAATAAGGPPGPVTVSRQTPGFSLRRAIQRRFSAAESPSGPTWPASDSSGPPAPDLAAGAPPAGPAPATVGALPALAPRRVSTVAPSAAVRPAALTTAPAAPVAPPLQRSAARNAPAPAARAPTPAASTLRSLFRPVTPEPAPPPVEFGSAPPPPRPVPAQPTAQRQPTAPRLTLGQSRRMGLGLPLGAPARSSPSPAAGGTDALPLAQPTAQRSAASPSSAGTPSSGPSAGGVGSSEAAAGASTAAATPPAAASSPAPSAATSISGQAGASTQEAAPPARGSSGPEASSPASPITGRTPLVQRSPAAGGGVTGGPSAASASAAKPSRLGLGEPLNLAPRAGMRGESDEGTAAPGSTAFPAGSPASTTGTPVPATPIQRTTATPPSAGSTGALASAGDLAALPSAGGLASAAPATTPTGLPDAPLLGAPLSTVVGAETSIASGLEGVGQLNASVVEAPLPVQRRSRAEAAAGEPSLQLEASTVGPVGGLPVGGQPAAGTIADTTPLSLAIPARPTSSAMAAAVTATTIGSIAHGGGAAAGAPGAAAQHAAIQRDSGGTHEMPRPVARSRTSGLFGSRPLVPAAVQRAGRHAVEAGSAGRSPARAPIAQRSFAEAPVRVWRDEAAGQAAGQLSAHAFTTGGEVFLPAQHGPLDSAPARGLLAHEMVHVQQQRALGSALPAEDSPPGRVLELQARRATKSSSNGDGAAAPLPLASPRNVARAVATEAATEAVSAAVAQRAVALAPPPIPSPVPLAPVQRVESTADTASGVESAPPSEPSLPTDPTQLEELAGRLWSHLRVRLRRELLADRERAGMLTDLR